MRLRLKRSLQITVVFAFLFLYLNFFLSDKTSLDTQLMSIDSVEGRKHPEQFEEIQTSVYPNKEYYSDDRILTQLKFVPKSIQRKLPSGDIKLKKILVYDGLAGWDLKPGQETFLQQKCAVPYCELIDSRHDQAQADVILFQGISLDQEPHPPHQKWVLFMLESPYHTQDLSSAASMVNWTASYRHDSTIVAPYEKFVPYNASIRTKPQTRNYAEGKTKKVAWFVSNCGARNNRRQYVEELAKHIQVDIYGSCGTLSCPRFESNKCFDVLNSDYKFYLSFENSNCRDYITEKFFINGLKNDVLPIVMGAAPEDYERAAPPKSYIHVDEFSSPKELAEYLYLLDNDDKLYNEYFQWKGTGDVINTFFWCRMCALANDEDTGPTWYNNLNDWWRGPDVCIGEDTWRNKKRTNVLIGELPIVLPPDQ